VFTVLLLIKICLQVEQQIEALVRHLELSDEDYAIRRRICCELQQLFDRDLAGLVHDGICFVHQLY
jgi:hypothetical protein